MSNWDEDEDGYCTLPRISRMRQLCGQLGIPLHKVSFAGDTASEFETFSRSTARPHAEPDVLCNREIKFGVC